MTFNQIPSWAKKKKQLKEDIKKWVDSGEADKIIEIANEKRKPTISAEEVNDIFGIDL